MVLIMRLHKRSVIVMGKVIVIKLMGAMGGVG